MPTVKLATVDLTPAERAFAERAAAILGDVVNRPEFAPRVAAATFLPTRRKLRDGTFDTVSDGHAILAIIQSGVQGNEPVNPPDHTIDLKVAVADLQEGMQAFTVARGMLTTLDIDFFNECVGTNDPARLASVLLHEWMHSAGFIHQTQLGDPNDVPFKVERVVRQLTAHPLGAGHEAESRAIAGAVDVPLWRCPVTVAAMERRR